MKTTVELSDALLQDAKGYAAERGMTFKQVLSQALDELIYDRDRRVRKSGWESLFGAFSGDPDNAKIQAIIDAECRPLEPEEWE